MSQFIPNENSWVGLVKAAGGNEFGLADINNPTVAEVDAAIDVTSLLVSFNATTTGNTVPVPRLSTLFEPSIAGTASGQMSADFYQDDAAGANIAWDNLPRGQKGSFILSRFGGTGPNLAPAVGQTCETWPFEVSSRGASNLANNTAQTFTMTAAVPEEPNEEAVVAA